MNQSNADQKRTPGTDEGATIFVVDDEPMLLELAVMILAPQGYRMMTFRSAEEALAAFTHGPHRPDVIITDYAMHEMTGMTLIEKCRQICPAQAAILVSGTVDERVFLHSHCKPDRFLAKPYPGKLLVRAVKDLLQRPQAAVSRQ